MQILRRHGLRGVILLSGVCQAIVRWRSATDQTGQLVEMAGDVGNIA
jgi:hypothetical protein